MTMIQRILTHRAFRISVGLGVVALGLGLSAWWIVRMNTAENLLRTTPPDAIMRALRARGYDPAGVFRRGLRNSDKLVRMKSVWGLGETGDTRDVKELAAVLSDKIPAMQEAAQTALGKYGCRASRALLARIRRNDIAVNGDRFASLLGCCGDATLVPALLDILRNGSLTSRRNAALALGRTGDRAAVGPLVTVLELDSLDVKIAAARALGELRAPEAVSLLTANVHGPEPVLAATAVRALGSIGDTLAVRDIASCLQHADTAVLAGAIASLGRIGSVAGVHPLLRLMREQGRPWRLYQAEITAAIVACVQGRIPELVALTNDSDPAVRSLAVGLLADARDPAAYPVLETVARSGPYETRKKAIAALGGFGERATPTLLRLLEDTSVYIRRDVLHALSASGIRRAAPVLLEIAAAPPARQSKEGSDRDLQWQEAVLALGKIGEQRIAPTLRRVVASRASHADRSLAAEVLGMLKDRTAVACLVDALADSSADTSTRIVGARGFDVRVGAAHALGAIGDPGALPALRVAQGCRNPDAQDAAARAVAILEGGSGNLPAILSSVRIGPSSGDR